MENSIRKSLNNAEKVFSHIREIWLKMFFLRFRRCESEKNYRPESAFACCICHVLYAKYRI